MSRWSGDFPVQLAMRLSDWSAEVYCSCPFVRLSCRSLNSTSPTRTTCCGHKVVSILIRHVRHARFPRDILATYPRDICYEDATRKLLPWNLSLTASLLTQLNSTQRDTRTQVLDTSKSVSINHKKIHKKLLHI